MQFGRIWIMRGPSIWARVPVIEAEVDQVESSSQVEALLRLTRLLQRGVGFEGQIAQVNPTRKAGFYRVVFDYDEESLGKACLQGAFDVTQVTAEQIQGEPEGTTPIGWAAVTKKQNELIDLAHHERLGPSTQGIVVAARRHGIPVRRLTSGSLVQLGWSKKLRRIWTAETDKTPILAETIAQDKDLTRQLLYDMGVPVPWGRPVTDSDDAWAAAEELGLPVVVKPRYGNQGRGVAANLNTEDQVRAAYDAARHESSFVMVENYLPGRDYRLLVVGDRLTAASLREPAHIVGDGVATIAMLVAEANKDPRRSDGHATPLSFIKIDAVAQGVLAEQGYTSESIPSPGTNVLIRRNANLSTGGTATDVTDFVHPDNAQAAIDAARVVGLDIAGVDFIVEDIARPYKDQGGGIVEVNAGPGLRMHLEPSTGQPRDVGAAIVASLFPEIVQQTTPRVRSASPQGLGAHQSAAATPGRIPVIAVTGVNGKTTTSRLIAHILRGSGLSVGLTCTDGIYLNGRRTETRDCSGPQSARAIFLNPRVDAAVLETARGGILREGLGFDQCDVGVITNIGSGDHFGLRGIETLEELARVKQVVAEAVAPNGWAVLNAADPLVAPMAQVSPGRILFFARDEHDPVLKAHRAAGGTSAFTRDSHLLIAHKENETTIATFAETPFLHGGVPFQVENALAAIAAAWGVGVTVEQLHEGLKTFQGNVDECPARFNVLEANGATVIVDYAHNPSAVAAMIAGLDVFPRTRRILVTSGSNRRDEDLIAMGEMAGQAFDRVILYADWGHAGRSDGELNTHLRQGLSRGGRVQVVLDAASERAALEQALAELQPGDLLVIGVEAIEESLAFVRNQLATRLTSLSMPASESSSATQSGS